MDHSLHDVEAHPCERAIHEMQNSYALLAAFIYQLLANAEAWGLPTPLISNARTQIDTAVIEHHQLVEALRHRL